jgi:hypothetical protein
VTHQDQQAGFVVVFTPSPEPLDNPALGYLYLDKLFQGRIYVVARANQPPNTIIPPPTSPQTTNATLEYDLVNGLTANGTTCTYEWGPILSMHRTGDSYEFNYSSTSPIDVYIFGSNWYNGTISCNLGPILKTPYTPQKLPTGDYGRSGAMCMGCEPGMYDYVLFINHDPTVTPHVTLRVAVTLQATTTTTTVSPPPSTIPFMGVPEILIAILLGFFLVAKSRRRRD